MSDTLITMYAAGTGGTEDAVANIDVPQDGTIVGIQVSHSAQLNADNEASTVSLSFIASNQITTNDTRGEIVVNRLRCGLLTSGALMSAHNGFVPFNLPVSGGERLHLHIVATAGIVTDISMIIHFDFGRSAPARRSRRRSQ